MSTPRLVPLDEVLHAIPRTINTIYAYSARGRWSSWVTRVGPDGRRTKHLWVNVPAAIEFWRIEGKPHIGEGIAAASGYVMEGVPTAA